MAEPHRLTSLLLEAAAGRFPRPDGAVEVLSSPPGLTDAVVAFTAHNVIAVAVEREEIVRHLPDRDPGRPMNTEFIAWLANRLETSPGMLDQVMVAPPQDAAGRAPELVPRDDLHDHPRVARSRRYRTDLRCYSDPDDRAVLILGRGLAGRWEIAVEVHPEHRGAGLGRRFARAGASLTDGEPLFAQVSPGNVASVRTFLSAGYRPVCAEVLFLRANGDERPPGP